MVSTWSVNCTPTGWTCELCKKTMSATKLPLKRSHFFLLSIFRYYQATTTEDPAARHIYSITDMEHPTPRNVTCLTCEMGLDCLHNDGQFAPDGQFFIVQCLGPGIPRTELRFAETNELKEVLNTFPGLANRLAQRAMPTLRHLKVATDEHIYVPVKLLLPPGLDEGDTMKYPIIVKL